MSLLHYASDLSPSQIIRDARRELGERLSRTAVRNTMVYLNGRLRAPLVNRGRVLTMRRSGGRVTGRFVPMFNRSTGGRTRRRRAIIVRHRRGRKRVYRTSLRRRFNRALRRVRRLARGTRRRGTTYSGGQRRAATHNVSIRYRRPRVLKIRLSKSHSRGWYTQGKWLLTGGYVGSRFTQSDTGQMRNIPQDAYYSIQFTTNPNGVTPNDAWRPLGFLGNVGFSATNFTGPESDLNVANTAYVDSSVAFNYTSWNIHNIPPGANPPSTTDDAYGLNSVVPAGSPGSISNAYSFVAPWVKATSIFFCYASNAKPHPILGDMWTSYPDQCRLPNCPVKQISFFPHNYFVPLGAYTSTAEPTVNPAYRLLPYSMKWSYVYARFRYAVKIQWPDAWGTLFENNYAGSSTSPSVLPDNPPLIIRFIGVRYMTDEYLTEQYFARYYFPINGSISSHMQKSCPSSLWNDYKGVVFFSKSFTFNGRLLPHSTGVENLSDGQEGVFTVRCPFATSNNYVMSIRDDSSASTAAVCWPTVKQGRIMFYCYCGLDNWMWMQNYATGQYATIDALCTSLSPKISVLFQPVYYCYPKIKAPSPRFITSTKAQSSRSAASFLALSPITHEFVSLKQANEESTLDRDTLEKRKALYEKQLSDMSENEKSINVEAPESAQLETHDSEVLSPDQTAATESSLPLTE